MSESSNSTERDRVGELIAAAGPRPAMPRERLETMRAAARESWKSSLGEGTFEPSLSSAPHEIRGAGPSWRWAVAASVVALALAAAWWLARRGDSLPAGGEERWAATVELVVGEPHVSGTADERVLTVGDRLTSGAVVAVGARGALALRFADGSLRVADGSSLRIISRREVALESGALYFDSGGASRTAGSAIAVSTAWGTVEDVGTQFEVRVDGGGRSAGGLRVRVREGEVEVRGEGVAEHVSAGASLRVAEDGEVTRGESSIHGEAWAWVLGAAPPFDPEGETLGSLLDWISRETAWTVRFEDPELAELRAETLHGPVVHRPDRGFQDLLTAVGLEGEVVEDQLVLGRAGVR